MGKTKVFIKIWPQETNGAELKFESGLAWLSKISHVQWKRTIDLMSLYPLEIKL